MQSPALEPPRSGGDLAPMESEPLQRLQRTLYERTHSHTLTAYGITRTLYRGSTKYQAVEICQNPDHGKLLLLDGELQSASGDEFIYHETLVQPAAVRCEAPRSALILGGGEGGTLRELLRLPTLERALMVDIDGEVVALCRKYLPEQGDQAFRDPRSELLIDDADAYLRRTDERFDLIVSDLTEPKQNELSTSLFSVEAFERIRKTLNPGGFFSLQASEGSLHRLESHLGIVKNLRAVFPRVLTLLVHIPSFACHWCFAVATQDGELLPTPEAIDERLAQRGMTDLTFYDGITDRRLRSLPRYLRGALDSAC